MSCSCLCENTLLMWEVRGKWPHWFRLVESGCVITCQTMKQKTTPGATLVKSASVACFPIIRMVSLDWSPFCIVADHIYSFMCSSSDGIFQQDNAPCYKARIISSCEWSSLSPDLNTIEQRWDVVELKILFLDVQQLCDVVISDRPKSSWNLCYIYAKNN